MTKRLLHSAGLSLQRGNQGVLSDVNLNINAGECVALAGANGAGKTTLLKCFMGLFPEATGEIILCGHNPRNLSPKKLSAFFAYAPQSPQSTWDYTVKEFSDLSPNTELYFHWIQRFSLTSKIDKKLSELSGGERKAVHLCLSLSTASNPKGRVFLFDEPAASLDICRAEVFSDVIRELTQQGAAALIATHDLAFAQKCQRVILLKSGTVMADGSAKEILSPKIISEIWGFSSASA